MPTRVDLKTLAKLRLEEAEHLYKKGLYDGCVYLCGYVVEFALKARICKVLRLSAYPEDLKGFKTHNFDELKVVAGLKEVITIRKNTTLFNNWSTATKWTPEQRYLPLGTFSAKEAKDVLSSLKDKPDGVLTWLSKRMVNNKTREQIRELLREVTREKGAFYLAMLAQSSPDLPDRWNFVVSAPWIDSTGSRSAVAYLSTKLKKHLDKNALSALDRISAIQSSDPIVTRILHFLGLSVSLQEGDFPIRNWIVGDWSIPEGYIFVADLDSDAHVRFTRSAREVQKSAR